MYNVVGVRGQSHVGFILMKKFINPQGIRVSRYFQGIFLRKFKKLGGL